MEKIKTIALVKPRLTALPFRKLAPNMVTALALCSGVTSIRYTMQEDWVKAVICIEMFHRAYDEMV